MLKALLRHGAPRPGGSTITQQLRAIFFDMFENTLTRKIKEGAARHAHRARVLQGRNPEMYLNQIYFEAGAHGLKRPRRPLRKHAKELTLGEATRPAGLPKNPRDYSPDQSSSIAP